MADRKAHGIVVDASSQDLVAVFAEDGSLLAANAPAERLLASDRARGVSRFERFLSACGAVGLAHSFLDDLEPFGARQCQDGSEAVPVQAAHVPRARQALSTAAFEPADRLEHSLTADFVVSPAGTIEHHNAEFARLFGRDEAASPGGIHLLDLVADSAARNALARALRMGETMVRLEVEMYGAGGRQLHATLSLWPLAGSGQQGALGAILDRTEAARFESQMLHSQRMEAVGRLAGGVAHDFNNLLTVILGAAQLLERSLDSGSDALRHAADIRDAAERAGELTRRLLAFGRRQLVRARELDLNELLHSLRKFLRSLLPNNIELDIIAGRSLARVKVDPHLIEQALMNLAVNARDAMAAGGRLTIETENVVLNGAYAATHPWANPGRYVLVTVSDTGCGMSPEVLAHAFEPFYTTKPPGKGSGLGLASTYGIVKQHDGLVHAYSEPGVGTTFKIYLPAVARAASEVGPKIRAGAAVGRETIVMAEDDPAVRSVLVSILENGGYHVLPARDGEEAVRLLQKNADRVRLALLDVMMPGIGGVGAYEQIRQLDANVPVLLMSGYSGEAVRDLLSNDEQLDFLAKPMDPDRLLAKVRDAIDARLGDTTAAADYADASNPTIGRAR
ncbi:MAG: response regulator [Deltaproteobacteria bacterium]|jgi:signal transduction histidine kinase/CheY-like chemotaxis protein|nr:response regulator [Deltaproteobacteria bacterium]MBW2537775.1 response regulator [Deltaproteobacteria bacterium]